MEEYRCSDCGRIIPNGHVIIDDGNLYCLNCYGKVIDKKVQEAKNDSNLD